MLLLYPESVAEDALTARMLQPRWRWLPLPSLVVYSYRDDGVLLKKVATVTPPRRAKLVLLVIAVAIVGLGVWAWEPVWWWVMTERVWEEVHYGGIGGHIVRGWCFRSRWGSADRHGPARRWYVANGQKAVEAFYGPEGTASVLTTWNLDGSVHYQRRGDGGRGVTSWSAPWLWGVTDQTEPSMPDWMKDDAKWKAALDAQRD